MRSTNFGGSGLCLFCFQGPIADAGTSTAVGSASTQFQERSSCLGSLKRANSAGHS